MAGERARQGWSRRRAVALLAAVAAAPGGAALAACGSSSEQAGTTLRPDQKVTVTYWGTASDTQGAGQQLLQRFQQTFPSVTLDFSPTGNNNDKFTAAIAAGTPPDVYYQDRNWTAEFAAKGFTANLDEYVKKSKQVKPDDWWPKPKADVTWKGHVHAVPRHGLQEEFPRDALAHPAPLHVRENHGDRVAFSGLHQIFKVSRDRKSTRLNSSHGTLSRMPSSA